ncbi:MAG: YqaE/Pmp3 family membrane protein [Gammaproteobacteria bacterium]|nr:YqaE/Pmp3 family membrane protein [Gammaproteobacteria bacterium]
MITLFKYIFTLLLPWITMIILEETLAAIITFFLQLSLVGWIPGSIWACSILKKHMNEDKSKAKTS